MSKGGPDNVTSTTNTEPPAFLLGPLTTAANAASNAFNASQPGGGSQNVSRIPYGDDTGFGGYGVDPRRNTGGGGNTGGGYMSDVGNAARRVGSGGMLPAGPNAPARGPGDGSGFLGYPQVNNQGQTINQQFQARQDAQRANDPNNLIPDSQRLVSQTIGGDFLNPESNPYLQGTFDRAADLTQTRLSSEFAGSGRNLGAAAPARSDELQTLASNIFGGNYQQERDRQLTGVGQASGLDPLNMLINRLGSIIPGAGGSSSSTQPVFRTGLF